MPNDPLYTIATLHIPTIQMQWIQDFRAQHDPHFTVVEPHFTMVFGVRGIEPSVYCQHVEAVAKAARPIPFRCGYAMLGADDVDDTAYVFLVPDEGNAEVSLLHDALYRGLLERYLRLEFPYIPHVTLASTTDFAQAKQLCDTLNEEGILVEGMLTSLTVGVLKDARLQPIRRFELGT
jgi:hypothetical protein